LISNLQTSKNAIHTAAVFLFMIYNQKIVSLDGNLLSAAYFSWPQVVQSVKGYCESPHIWIEHVEMCNKLSTTYPQSKTLSTSITDFSLQYFFANILFKTYQKLPLNDQLIFLKKFPLVMTSFIEDDDSLLVIQSIHGYYAYTKQELNRWSYYFNNQGFTEYSLNLDKET
jgi:hypothetical protein